MTLAVTTLASRAWATGPVEPAPDAELLLNFDLLKETDLARDRDLYRRLSLFERMRMLEQLRVLDSPTVSGASPGQAPPAPRPPASPGGKQP
ncbi:MAG: hypothetical protein HY294_04345 [Candidatus Rokubacteria bacterium]|nr:hypothetical protein [Candidatus Rokubacteria bacterium]MBI3825204.1 hypothetical protein [Candidatus Rokubacteria bacterium]